MSINGPYSNISVEDCIFIAFSENGIFLKGSVGTANPQKLKGVLLRNVQAINNKKNGLKINENTYQIDVVGGSYSKNRFENGIYVGSNYKDPLRYTVNPDLFPNYFPNDVRIFNATISNNYENGIHVDAERYYRYLEDIDDENNTIIIDGNQLSNNLANGVKNTDFSTGLFRESYFINGNNITNNSLVGINVHTKKTQGPNGTEIRCNPSNNYPNANHLAESRIDFIYLNRIEGNKNGIEVTIDSSSTPNSDNSCGFAFGNWRDPFYVSSINQVYANRIRYNKESGVLLQLKNPFPFSGNVSDFSSVINGGEFTQNIISFNGNNGVFLNGSSSSIDESFSYNNTRVAGTTLICNDIISNRDYGVNVIDNNDPLLKEFSISLTIVLANIIENNLVGGVKFNFTSPKTTYNIHVLGVHGNYIGNHPLFDIYNGVLGLQWFNNQISRNDFIGAPILAFDVENLVLWKQNFWSDYSPGCVDGPPADGWCDVPRPIPIANQDIQPKAGSPWGQNTRGYLKLDQGILLSQCLVNVLPYPPRPSPSPPPPPGWGKID